MNGSKRMGLWLQKCIFAERRQRHTHARCMPSRSKTLPSMNIESFRTCCLSLPLVTEDFPFDENVLVFRVYNKIFACVAMNHPEVAVMKCDPERAIELRERYGSIEAAWHWNKKYWNQVRFRGDVPDRLFRDLAGHAYCEVWKKLPRRLRGSSGIVLPEDSIINQTLNQAYES